MSSLYSRARATRSKQWRPSLGRDKTSNEHNRNDGAPKRPATTFTAPFGGRDGGGRHGFAHTFNIKKQTPTIATMIGAKQDEELNLLLTKLYTIQEQVGAKDKTSDEEKRARAERAGHGPVAMGKGKRGKRTGSRFLELKSSIVDTLKTVHGLIEEQANSKRTNPKEAISAQAEIRECVRKAGEEWDELNELYKKEARKNKSKFTPEELELQSCL